MKPPDTPRPPLSFSGPPHAAATRRRGGTGHPEPGLDYLPAADTTTLPAMFAARVRRSPERVAYQAWDPAVQDWRRYSWAEVGAHVENWRAALAREGLAPGERVAIRRGNGYPWVLFDQAALSLGLVVVPLYVDDRPDNVAYVLDHAGVKLLYLQEAAQWQALAGHADALAGLQRVVVERGLEEAPADGRVVALEHWLAARAGDAPPHAARPDDLATIVYTSGTTGRPKGVMLSHRNILSNIRSGLHSVAVYPGDRFLSFLPLSHTLERTVGYYLPIMAGAEVVYARSVAELAEDLATQRPTLLVSVPRIYERVHARLQARLAAGSALQRALFRRAVQVGYHHFEYRQGRAAWGPDLLLHPLLDRLVGAKVRARLGGRLRIAVSGGAPLPPAVSRVFVGLGVNILQGYGLTESSPIISVNTLERNKPESIGLPLKDVEVRIGERDELLARGPNIMLGYWKDPEATRAAVDEDGWLHTGDQARRDEEGFLYITGRIKEIIVLANGEKVPPADMESAIAEDPLFEQTMVVGEGRPYLAALVVLDRDQWARIVAEHPDFDDLEGPAVREFLLERLRRRLAAFPGYAQIHAVTPLLAPWTIENGLLTPTMKIRRSRIAERYREAIEAMYAGHA